MNRINLGKSIISFVIAASAIVSTLVDWNESHLFNPTWHGHAKFHDALMLCLLIGVSIVALWQLWRDAKEPEVAIKIAALVPVAFWSPFYYISLAIPGTSLLAETVEKDAFYVGGTLVYFNVTIGSVMLLLTAVGYALTRSEQNGAR